MIISVLRLNGLLRCHTQQFVKYLALSTNLQKYSKVPPALPQEPQKPLEYIPVYRFNFIVHCAVFTKLKVWNQFY